MNTTITNIQEVIHFLKIRGKAYANSGMSDEAWSCSDYLDCFIAVEEDYIDGDFEHLNYKLFQHFRAEWIYIGNPTRDGELHVSKSDLTKENIEHVIRLAVLHVLNHM